MNTSFSIGCEEVVLASPELLVCTHCRKEFDSSQALISHAKSGTCARLVSSSNFKPLGGVNCSHCNKNFANNSGLDSHSRFCKQNPLTKGDYESFVKEQAGNKDNRCGGCRKTFLKVSGLYSHSQYCKKMQDYQSVLQPDKSPIYDVWYDTYGDVDHTEDVVKNEPDDGDSQQVKLSLTFVSPLVTSLSFVQHHDPYHDVTLVTSDRSLVTCHGAVLGASSLFFRKLLSDACREEESVLIIANNMEKVDLDQLLNFVYNGKVEVDEERLEAMKELFNELGIAFGQEVVVDNGVNSDFVSSHEVNGHMEFGGSDCDLPDTKDSDDGSDRSHVSLVPKTPNKKRGHPKPYTDVDGSDLDLNTIDKDDDSDSDYVPEKEMPKKMRGRPKNSELISPESPDNENFAIHCDYCGKKYSNIHFAMKHVSQQHKEFLDEFLKKNKTVPCKFCDEMFINESSEKKHRLNVHGTLIHRRHRPDDGLPQDAERACQLCPRILKDYETWKDHHQVHITGSDWPYSCPTCGKKFQRGASHKNHVELHAESPAPLLCTECGSTFSTEFDYRRHKKSHNIRNSKNRKGKGKHIKKKDKVQEEPYFSALCNICGKNFTKKQSFKYHTKTAHLEKSERFQCPHCPQTCPNKQQMNNHIKLHLPPTIQCDQCPKKFRNKYYLTNHISKLHTPDNMKDFVCQQCGKGFTTKDNYEGHINMHLGLKPFRCRFCEMTYQNRSNQQAHEKSKHPELYTTKRKNLGGVPVGKRTGLNGIT